MCHVLHICNFSICKKIPGNGIGLVGNTADTEVYQTKYVTAKMSSAIEGKERGVMRGKPGFNSD